MARRWAPWIVAMLAVAAPLAGLLVGFEPVGGDPDRLYRPIKQELARALRAGRLPFWSDRFGVGMPLVAESHVAALYPPNLALYRVLGVTHAYRLAMGLHYLLLVATTFAYARTLGVGPWGSGLAAVSFALCGFQAIHSSHEPFYHVIVYIPLMLLAAERYLASARLAWLVLLAAGFGVSLTLGHFQLQGWTAGVVLSTGAWRCLVDRRPARRGLALAIALAWGAAMAAMQLGPTWELAEVAGMAARSPGELASYAYPPSHWPELFFPRLFAGLPGGPEGPYWVRLDTTRYEACFYVGTIPLILAAVGLTSMGRDRALRPWAVVVPVAFALATLPFWSRPGFANLALLPGFGHFRCPARYTLWCSLGLALLAGRGLDRLMEKRSQPTAMAVALLLALVAAVAAVAYCGSVRYRAVLAGARLWSALGEGAIAWAIGLAAVLAWRRGRVGPWALLVLTALELGTLYHRGTTRWGWSRPWPTESPVFRALAREKDVGLIGGQLDDLPVRAGFVPAAPYFGFRLPNPPYKPLEAAKVQRIGRGPEAAYTRSTWLRRLGVTHGVWDSRVLDREATLLYEGPDPDLDRLVYLPTGEPSARTWRVTRSAGALPRVRVARQVRVAYAATDLLRGLERAVDADEAWFAAATAPRDIPGPPARTARIVSWRDDVGLVDHDGTAVLVVNRMAYPGWTARLDDGPERPTSTVDFGLQGILLTGSGRTKVALRYRPTGLGAWAILSSLAVAAAPAALILARRRRAGDLAMHSIARARTIA
ncbi:MAG TPA: hypothetical protein VG406_20915 [Isosphaeraceae bacterium]|jgi:hypothetical protein|nr:hypothetical protein [Isosphaeraceae bacterium]